MDADMEPAQPAEAPAEDAAYDPLGQLPQLAFEILWRQLTEPDRQRLVKVSKAVQSLARLAGHAMQLPRAAQQALLPAVPHSRLLVPQPLCSAGNASRPSRSSSPAARENAGKCIHSTPQTTL